MGVYCLPYRHTTPARRAPPAVIYRRTIGRHKQNFCVSIVSYENHADVVGAINILERGYRLLACGESVQSGRSVKQEPTEATRKSSRSAVGIPVL